MYPTVPLFTAEEANKDRLRERNEEDQRRPEDGPISCQGLSHERTNMNLKSIAELM